MASPLAGAITLLTICGVALKTTINNHGGGAEVGSETALLVGPVRHKQLSCHLVHTGLRVCRSHVEPEG